MDSEWNRDHPGWIWLNNQIRVNLLKCNLGTRAGITKFETGGIVADTDKLTPPFTSPLDRGTYFGLAGWYYLTFPLWANPRALS